MHPKCINFVKGAVEAYKTDMPTKVADTPYPTKCALTKDTVVDQSEIDLYTQKGYARIVGLLMWARLSKRSFKRQTPNRFTVLNVLTF